MKRCRCVTTSLPVSRWVMMTFSGTDTSRKRARRERGSHRGCSGDCLGQERKACPPLPVARSHDRWRQRHSAGADKTDRRAAENQTESESVWGCGKLAKNMQTAGVLYGGFSLLHGHCKSFVTTQPQMYLQRLCCMIL